MVDSLPEELPEWQYLPFLLAHSPNGRAFTLDTLFVLGPYPTREFFRTLQALAGPARTILAVDSAWPEPLVERIRDVLGDRLTVRRVSARGLVHAKVYWMRWTHPRRSSHEVLVFGSGNASAAGFGSNAETLCSTDLRNVPPGQRKRIREWITALVDGKSVKRQWVFLADDHRTTLLLPAVRVQRQQGGNFASWLLAGRLCHQWAPDASFGRFPLRLKKALPAADLETLFENHNLSRSGERNQLTFRYAGLEASHGQSQWKAQFFVDTLLGHWTSYDCFADLHTRFVAGGTDAREKELREIADADGSKQRQWLDEFLANVERATAELRSSGFDPDDYLETGSSGVARVRARARRVLKAHIARSRQADFRDRFVARFEFPKMPRLSEDRASLKAFQLSFCESLIVARCTNRRLRLLAALDGLPENAFDAPDTLRKVINDRWSELRPLFTAFHRPTGLG